MRKKILTLFITICLGLISVAQHVKKVSHVAFTVSNTTKAVTFLQNTLEATKKEEINLEGATLQRLYGINDKDLSLKITTLSIGEEEIRLLEFFSSHLGRKIPHNSKSNDLWFQHIAVVVNNMDKAYKKVAKLKVTHVSTAPQTLPDYIPAAAGISAFYFRDQDAHNLELINFPKGKGNPKWQQQTSTTFLGIDHTAIGISDTDEALKFYSEILGLKVAGNSENYGPEQEHLNQVFGARLLITGLQAPEGFGVEFLQYIAPPGGSKYPKNSSALDYWYWHTAMEVDSLEKIKEKLQQNNYEIVSAGIQTLPELGYRKVIIVRDYDGHAVMLYEK